MATVKESSVCLRIMGDSLDPDRVSLALGGTPTLCYRKGEKIWNPAGTRARIAKFGGWHLRLDRRSPGDLDGQIDELLSMLSDDLAIWKALNEAFEMDVFTGVFLEGPNEGISLKPSTMLALGSRGLLLDLDIYSGSDQDEGD